MRYTVNLRDQPVDYLERLLDDIVAEVKFREAKGRKPSFRDVPRCTGCGHTDHNIMTCGGRGFPRKGNPCDCGRSDCPNPEVGP
jgi:hypothetical protein